MKTQKPNRAMAIEQKPHHIPKTAKTSRYLALLSLVAFTASASAQETAFGTDNGGYGGFTAETAEGNSTPIPEWSLTADAARLTNAATSDTGQVNTSLLKDFTLSRTDGSSAAITGVLHIESAYAADNIRFGISLFANTGDLAGIDSGLSLQHNIGNGQMRILNGGVNGSSAISETYGGLNLADAIGTTFTYRADLTFVETNIEIDFTLTDQNDFSQTISTTVVAADFTGTYFGFGSRGRIRYNNPGVNDVPIIYDANTFSVIDLSEGPTLSIMPSATTPGYYNFTWTSKDGREYDLVSNTDLSTAIETWPVWEGQANLPATPPDNVLAEVPGGGDPRRFFAVIERIPPPLFSENFDAAAELPAGWTRNGPVNGSIWEIGTPSGVLSGPATAFTEPNCAGTNIGGLYTENTDISLVSPVIAIPADRGATLSFMQLIDTDAFGDFGSVRVLDADNADTPIAGLELSDLQGFGSAGDGWTENTLTLPALEVGGKNIKIEFNFASNANLDVFGGFYVDDVTLTLD